MRRRRYFLPTLTLAIALCGCDSERERLLSEKCLLDEAASGTSALTARAYCECALDKIFKHYPSGEEVLDSKDSVALARDLEICRRSVQ